MQVNLAQQEVEQAQRDDNAQDIEDVLQDLPALLISKWDSNNKTRSPRVSTSGEFVIRLSCSFVIPPGFSARR